MTLTPKYHYLSSRQVENYSNSRYTPSSLERVIPVYCSHGYARASLSASCTQIDWAETGASVKAKNASYELGGSTLAHLLAARSHNGIPSPNTQIMIIMQHTVLYVYRKIPRKIVSNAVKFTIDQDNIYTFDHSQ